MMQYNEALEMYDKAIHVNPSYVAVYNAKGNILREVKEYN